MTPTRLGQVTKGCMFVGINRIQNQAYGILVSPYYTETKLSLKTTNTHTPNTQSLIDGFANTHAMNDSSHPAAQYCASLEIGSNRDFYLPAKNELELCYRRLTPQTKVVFFHYSKNNSSIPIGNNCSLAPPGLAIEVNTNFEFKLSAFYHSSSEAKIGSEYSSMQDFYNGRQGIDFKGTPHVVRAVRRQLIVEI